MSLGIIFLIFLILLTFLYFWRAQNRSVSYADTHWDPPTYFKPDLKSNVKIKRKGKLSSGVKYLMRRDTLNACLHSTDNEGLSIKRYYDFNCLGASNISHIYCCEDTHGCVFMAVGDHEKPNLHRMTICEPDKDEIWVHYYPD